MDRSGRIESGRQPASTLVQPPDGRGAQTPGRCRTIVLSRCRHWLGRDRRAIHATAWPPRRSAGRARPQPQLNDTRPDRGHHWPAGLPRPPPASPAPGLTEPTAERLAERADAADTRWLDTRTAGHRTAWTPDGWTLGWLDTGRLDHGRQPPGRLDRGRLDRRADAKQSARAGAGRRNRRPGIPDQRDDAALSRTAVRGFGEAGAACGDRQPGLLGGKHYRRDSGHGRNQAAPRWHSAVQAAPRRTALLRRLRVESRANGEASSVMTRSRIAGRAAGGGGCLVEQVRRWDRLEGWEVMASGAVFASTARAPRSHSSFVCRVWQRERLAPAWMTALDRLPGQTIMA
jgi:hypothetical protein